MSRDKKKRPPHKQTAPEKKLVPQLLTLETIKLQLRQAELRDQQQQQMATADQVGEQLRVTAARLYWRDQQNQPDARHKEEKALIAQQHLTLKAQRKEVGQQLKETQKQLDATTKQLHETLLRLKEELELELERQKQAESDSDSDWKSAPDLEWLSFVATDLILNPGAKADQDQDSNSNSNSNSNPPPPPAPAPAPAPAPGQVASKSEPVPEPEPEPEPEPDPVPQQEPLLPPEPTAGSHLPSFLFTGATALAATVYYYMHQDQIDALLMGSGSASSSGW